MSDTLKNKLLVKEVEISYDWSYANRNEILKNLYEKAKCEQWNASTDINWSIEVDPENPEIFPETSCLLYGSKLFHKLTPKERNQLRYESMVWRLSNFLHGEQGALLTTSQIVVCVPYIDAKLYGSTQVVDEGRHVEVYQRYLTEKMQSSYPINNHLKSLLDILLKDKHWDIKYLGMQIIIEGLALASITLLRQICNEPLLGQILKYILQDEARHVSFGLISVADFYRNLTEKERQEREIFAYEACELMWQRLIGTEVFEKLGLPLKECLAWSNSSSGFRQLLFSKIMPNLKKLGLISDHILPKYEQLITASEKF